MEHWISSNIGDPMTVVLAAVITIAVGTVLGFSVYDRRQSIKKYLEHRRDVRIQRGLLMGKKKKAERQSYVRNWLATGLTNLVEEGWFKGEISREEGNEIYRMIGKTHHIPELLPVMSPEQVKSAIKGRRSRGINTPAQEQPAWGESPAAKVGKDGEQDDTRRANVINATKRFGEKALARLKKTG